VSRRAERDPECVPLDLTHGGAACSIPSPCGDGGCALARNQVGRVSASLCLSDEPLTPTLVWDPSCQVQTSRHGTLSSCSSVWGVWRRPAPIDHTSQAAPARRQDAMLGQDNQRRACHDVGDLRATTLYAVWDARVRGLVHPNHDAVMRIDGEAPRRRAQSLPRYEDHGLGRVTATSDRLGVASRRSG
jgi:hypothetical protein